MAELPLGRRLRVWVLSGAQAFVERAPGLADAIRGAVPEPVWRLVRRAGAPVRIPTRAAASIPLGDLPPEPRVEGAPSSPEVSVVIPVHGEWAHTRLCLASLRAHTDEVVLEVVVVDDASTDETAE